MGSQGAGRKRLPTRERLTAEDDALNQIAREAEARLAAKRAARAEAREIRMKELERQQKEEDSERCSRRARRNPSASDEDELVSLGSRGSLRPPEYSSFLASGSRASSRASSARASPVIEERPEKDFEKGARCVSSLSAATLASLGGTSSRRGSGDTSISADTEASIREIKDLYELKDQIQDVEGKYMQGLKEMKDSLAEVEEKYKKAMVSNAQLDNDKTNFMYQVDTLKDALLELEEQLAESRRQYQEKSKELEREKHAHSILHFQFLEIKEALKQREEMLAEIQQLQQTHQSHVREIADLQETIEWKDKKIGALERQRDSLESVRSERDDLRDEVVVLKEQLKKHGIIPSSAIATNGETPASLENEGHLDPSRNVPLKPGGDGILGKATGVEMRSEILEDVGEGELVWNAEHGEEEAEEQEGQMLHPEEKEEHGGLSAVVSPERRLREQSQSPSGGVSGDESDPEGWREESTAAQQPVRREAEHQDFMPRTNQILEVGSSQAQEMPSGLSGEHGLGKASSHQEEGGDLRASHGLRDGEVGEEGDTTSGSCELVPDQAALPELPAAGLLGEEGHVENQAEWLQTSGERSGNEVPHVLEEKVVEGRDFTAEGQVGAMKAGGLEGKESPESGGPDGGGDQAGAQPPSSEDNPSASPEEQNRQDRSKLEGATAEDGQEEVLVEELELSSGSGGTGGQKAPVKAPGCVPEGKEPEPEPGPGEQGNTQGASSGAGKTRESELKTVGESGKRKESRTGWGGDGTAEVGPQIGEVGAQAGEVGPQAGEVGAQTSEEGLKAGEVGPQADEVEAETSEEGPQVGEVGPQAGEVGPQADEVEAETSEEGPQVGEVGPQAGEVEAETSEEGPQVGEVEPQAGEVGPQAGEVEAETSEEGPQVGEVEPQAGEVGPQAGEVEAETSEEGPQVGEVEPQAGEVGGQAGEVGPQTGQCGEAEIGGGVGEDNIPLGGEVQGVGEQEEGEPQEEPTVDVGGAPGNQFDKETLRDNEKELELAEHCAAGVSPVESVNHPLAQRAGQDGDSGAAQGRLEDAGEAFGGGEESEELLGRRGAEGALAGGDSLHGTGGNEPEGATRCLRGEAPGRPEVVEDETVLRQDLGSSPRDGSPPSKEELQAGRRGKGKPREDCAIS
ncbi:leucine-rich repeat flightless-interacting protein 1 isoform X5 [Apus apus]|uniref:leucine-rich repeat flightless-interacting protein 1 isoform X5 n=1 Tax=Apus apus TaxID=8895 RepID=UPI0021F8E548|nr:leucine-rich repeat flightless-interacting protein 1 isoform X5 [Apus apus]